MTTQPAKKSNTQSSAKSSASKAAESTSENVVKIGSAAVKELLANGANEAQKVREKAMEISRESADKLAKSADVISKSACEVAGLSRGNMEAAVECGNLTASFAKDLSSEIFEYTNKAFSDNLEISKEIFSCRTITEMAELQNRIIKNSLHNFLNETGKIAGMLFEYSQEAFEPINERISEATEQLNKTIASCSK
jgi:phasin family protein